MKTRTLVLMGKSAKMNNFCTGGIDLATGEWIRLISEDPAIEEAVPPQDMRYKDGTLAQLFDVLKIVVSDKKANNAIQPENIYYDNEYYWLKVGHMTLQEIIDKRGFDDPAKIFYNDERAVPAEDVKNFPVRESLLLLPVKNIEIEISTARGYPKFYADFNYRGKRFFHFSVGDLEVRNQFKNRDDGKYPFKKSAAVVFSLTNPFHIDNKCYKMVAQVF